MPVSENELSTLLHEPAAPTIRSQRYAISVVSGPDRGRSVQLDALTPSRVLVGQGAACGLVLGDRSVSRRHLALDVDERGLRVTDLGSKNGTFVQGVRALDCILRGGETIQLGATVLRVEAGTSEPVVLTRELRFGRVLGGSVAMRRLYPLLARVAASDVPLVIEGETGTGKELVAESIHEESPRADGPFVVFDCTAVSPSLVESALFGHERGAFTGATATRRGVFEQAHGGTLLIDEIGDLEASMQAKLLRAVERKEVQRVGGERWIKVDARVIAATRRDLDAEVQAKRFRDDLFFRLAVARIELPALRERAGDVLLLARHFWRELGGEGTPDELMKHFESYTWPGNVRELANCIARRVALGESHAPPVEEAQGATLDPFASMLAQDVPFLTARDRVLDEFERRYVEAVLARYDGNVTRAAAASGIARRYFYTIRARRRT